MASDRPTYEELERRVAELEERSRQLTAIQGRLRRNLNFTESLLASIPTPIFYKDASGRYLGCNAAFTEVMGVSEEEIRGKTVGDLWPSEHAETYHKKDLELLENPQLQVYEFKIRDRHGDLRPVVYYKNVYRDEKGDIAGLVGGFVDISDIFEAQQELEAIFSMSLDMICIADIHTATFLKVNPAFVATLGYSEEELLSVPFTDFIHPDDVQSTRRVILEKLGKGEKIINFKNRYRCRTGEYRWFSWVSRPILEKGVAYAVAHDISDEMRSFETLRSQRDLLNSLFENLPAGIALLDAEGGILMLNKGFSQITGYTRKDLSNLDEWFEKAYPDDAYRHQVAREWAADRKTSDAVRTFKVTCRGDMIKDIEFHVAFLEDGRALLTLTDVTEIKKAQEEIRRRRRFLESVLYHAPDAIITLDRNHHVIDWNPGATKMFGYMPEEAIGMQLDDLVAKGKHHNEAGKKTHQVLSGQRVEAFETIRFRKDGSPINVIGAGSPILVDGELKGVVAMYTDITDRVQGEEALKTAHKTFLTVLDSIDASIYAADLTTYEILFMNRHMIEALGGDFTGEKCWKVFRKGSVPCDDCTNDRLIDAAGNPTGVIVWQNENPISGRWYTNHDRAIEWIDGRQVRIQIATDITDLMQLEEGLRQAQKMEAVGTLAGGVAHDFNNMLGAMMGRAELMLLEMSPEDPHRQNLREIQKVAERSAELTKQLLAFARKQPISPKVLSLNDVVDDSLKMLRRLIGEDIDLNWHPATNLWPVRIDPTQVDQMLANLCVNARDAIAGNGIITIETENLSLGREYREVNAEVEPGEYVMLALKDNGCGMDKGILANVFEPFFTTKDVGEGTGLGLATVYGIVKQNNGFIQVFSEPGVGTAFKIYFPRADAVPEELEKEQHAVTVSGGTERILVVEDDLSILSMITTFLKHQGYDVVGMQSPSRALDFMANCDGEIDLLLTDVVMPNMNGRELHDRIIRLQPQIKVVYMSGYTSNVIVNRGVLEDDVTFLQKPFSVALLAKTVRAVLDGSPAPAK